MKPCKARMKTFIPIIYTLPAHDPSGSEVFSSSPCTGSKSDPLMPILIPAPFRRSPLRLNNILRHALFIISNSGPRSFVLLLVRTLDLFLASLHPSCPHPRFRPFISYLIAPGRPWIIWSARHFRSRNSDIYWKQLSQST